MVTLLSAYSDDAPVPAVLSLFQKCELPVLLEFQKCAPPMSPFQKCAKMMMATAAFGGYDLTIEAYKLALKHKYQFGCFGDAILMLDD